MKGCLKAGIAVMLILTLMPIATSCRASLPLATPEETVNTYLDAVQDLDVDGMLACVDGDIPRGMRERAEETAGTMREHFCRREPMCTVLSWM